MIFVDTGAWFAAFVPNDRDHVRADTWLSSNTTPLVTSDYILDELLTLLKARGEYQRALHLGQCLLTEKIARLEWVLPADVEAAWQSYRTHRDKDWSFTDCVSLAVMKRLRIRKAFSFDEHFRQFAAITVVPL
ncbi:MAG: PIN domain-containing protein [Planctomycetota bacterium]|nr:PIN domain-containing protein [Planctomycetota bacterium]